MGKLKRNKNALDEAVAQVMNTESSQPAGDEYWKQQHNKQFDLRYQEQQKHENEINELKQKIQRYEDILSRVISDMYSVIQTEQSSYTSFKPF